MFCSIRFTFSCQSHLQYLAVKPSCMKWFRNSNLSKVSRTSAALVPSATSRSYATSTTAGPDPQLSGSLIEDADEECLYRYTTGRWLWNEKYQLSRRNVKFNLPELTRIAKNVTGSRSCTDILKLSEGQFNKVFLMTIHDGKEVIAKLPNPNAGRAYFTTASEVATMNFVRDVLNVPAPKVFAWNPSKENPVGAEYIFMERSRGIVLGKVWHNLPSSDKIEIIRKLVEFDKAFAAVEFPMYGSLYYAEDLLEVQPNQLVKLKAKDDATHSSFAVGPTTNRAFFDDGRDAVDMNRGAWPSLDDYILSRAHRELACLQIFSEFPRQQGLFNGPGQYCPTKEAKAEALHNYTKTARFLLPKNMALSKPVLWHPDLHTDNIFVNPDKPAEIITVIDWQGVNLSPLFLQARHPELLRLDGPSPEGFEINLPENFDDLSQEEQLRARKLRIAQSLYKLYELELFKQCPDVYHALRFGNTLAGSITGLAGSIFSDGEPIIQGRLIRLQDEWSTCIGSSTPCPLSFAADDRKRQREDEARWRGGVKLMDEFLDEVGAYRGWDGWVSHSNYEVMKERLGHCREGFLRRHATTDEERRKWMEIWPYTDK